MLGRADVFDSVNIAFKADLTPWTAHRPAGLYFIENDRIRGSFLTINARDRWAFLISAMGAFGYAAGDITSERAADIIRLAAGVPDLDIKIVGIAPWTASLMSLNSTATGASSLRAMLHMRCRRPAASA